MIALIAEKPSVAKDIARIIGATGRNDGYLSGNGYMVTWAFGHLIQLAMPEAYGVANFRRESLPILPPDFQLIPRQVKAEKGYKADPGVLKQLKVIKEVFDQCDKIIVATDAGREGELIFRYIFHYLNCRKPFVRLWISSLTDKAIREGLDNLQPGERYDNLYLSAKSRSEADWLIGINATQAFERCRRAGGVLTGQGADTHARDDMQPLFGEQEFRTRQVLATQSGDRQRGNKFHRPIDRQVGTAARSHSRPATGKGCRATCG